jgi:hypothetical protein
MGRLTILGFLWFAVVFHGSHCGVEWGLGGLDRAADWLSLVPSPSLCVIPTPAGMTEGADTPRSSRLKQSKPGQVGASLCWG